MKINIIKAKMKNNRKSPKLWETGEDDRRKRMKEKEKEYQNKSEKLETVFTHLKKILKIKK